MRERKKNLILLYLLSQAHLMVWSRAFAVFPCWIGLNSFPLSVTPARCVLCVPVAKSICSVHYRLYSAVMTHIAEVTFGQEEWECMRARALCVCARGRVRVCEYVFYIMVGSKQFWPVGGHWTWPHKKMYLFLFVCFQFPDEHVLFIEVKVTFWFGCRHLC